MNNDGFSVADALALQNRGGDGFGFGDNGAWWIFFILILFAYGGWGNGGWGNNSNNACCTPASMQGVTDAFNFNALNDDIRSVDNALNSVVNTLQNSFDQTQTALTAGFGTVNQGIANAGYGIQNSLNQSTNSIMQAIANQGFATQQGFCDVGTAILQSTYQTSAGLTALGNQIASNACDIERGQDALRTEIATATNQILTATDRSADRIIDYLTQAEMDKLRSELQSAKFQISQQAQTESLVNQLMPVAKPAYITCSPYAASMGLTNCGCSNCA